MTSGYTDSMRFFVFLAIILFPITAKADYFLWQEPDSGLTITFPDTWKTQNNRNPDDVLSISGPSAGDDPTCQVKISEDKRYVIYPARLGDAVQREAVSTPFWQSYMTHYDQTRLDRVYDGAGLGRWLASYATASYSKRDGTSYQQRRAIMFASLYNDTLYIIECSSLNHAYGRWENNFRSIIKSIDFKKAYHQWPIGDYNDFMMGAQINFWAQTGPEGTVRY